MVPFDPTSIRLVVHAGISPLQICLDGLLGLLLDSLSALSSKLAQRLSKPAGRIVLESPGSEHTEWGVGCEGHKKQEKES